MTCSRFPLAFCASILTLPLIYSPAMAFQSFDANQQSGNSPVGQSDPYEIRGTAGFGSGAQVEIEPNNFPERREANRNAFEAQTPQSIATRQTRFGIPFNVTQGAVVVEAQLHVSTDQGATWKMYSRQPPQAREFPFKTNQDGEFWFAIKTIDQNGIASPEGRPRPDMIIVVDTTDPEINFNVHTDESGKLECWFLANDRTLDTKTLEISYRPHSPFRMNLARWKRAEFASPSGAQSPGRYESRVSFFPETESLTLDVQAKISDQAGNVSTVDRQVLLSRLVDPKQRTGQRPPSVDPYGARQNQIARQIRWSDQKQELVASNLNGWRSAAPEPQVANNAASQTQEEFRQRQELVANKLTVPPRYSASGAPATSPMRRDGWQSSPQRIADERGVGQGGLFETQPSGTERDRFVPRNESNELQRRALSESQQRIMRLASDSRGTGEPNSATSGGYSSPGGEATSVMKDTGSRSDFDQATSTISSDNIRLSNSRRFQLEYEIDSIGPAGVAKVDIWMTQDEGRSWFVWGQDEDRRSPIIVSVDDDGLYGFRIGVTGQNGLSARSPRGGDDADVWIGVDSTKPIAKITSVPYGTGIDAGHLLINWEANDRQLDPEPITLLYAAHPDGPWNEIASGIANSGSYKWRIEERMPREVYLRIEARDTAGNTAVYILNNPVNLAGLVPRGRIRTVQPLP